MSSAAVVIGALRVKKIHDLEPSSKNTRRYMCMYPGFYHLILMNGCTFRGSSSAASSIFASLINRGRLINPLCTGRLFHCCMLDESICHFRDVGSIFCRFYYFFLIENPVSKQCRIRSDATLCGVWAGSALFDYDPFTGFQVRMG